MELRYQKQARDRKVNSTPQLNETYHENNKNMMEKKNEKFIYSHDAGNYDHPNKRFYQGSYPTRSQSLRFDTGRRNMYDYPNEQIVVPITALTKRSQSARSLLANSYQNRNLDTITRSGSAGNVPIYEDRDELEHVREDDTNAFHPTRHYFVVEDNLIRNEREDIPFSKQEMLALTNYPRLKSYPILRDGSISRSLSTTSRDMARRGVSTSFRRRVPTVSQSISMDDTYSYYDRSEPFEIHPFELLNKVLDYTFVILNAACLAVCHFDDGDARSRKYSFD